MHIIKVEKSVILCVTSTHYSHTRKPRGQGGIYAHNNGREHFEKYVLYENLNKQTNCHPVSCCISHDKKFCYLYNYKGFHIMNI